MFIIHGDGDTEVLLNTDRIWRIEIEYSKNGFSVSTGVGRADPTSQKKYKVWIGSDVIDIPADPNHPLAQVIGEIYKNATRI
jgi:hypothetical protein